MKENLSICFRWGLEIREDSSYKKKNTNFFTKQSEPRVYLRKKSVSYINIRRPEMTDKEKRIRSLIANRSVISLDDIEGGIPTNYNSEICVVKL